MENGSALNPSLVERAVKRLRLRIQEREFHDLQMFIDDYYRLMHENADLRAILKRTQDGTGERERAQMSDTPRTDAFEKRGRHIVSEDQGIEQWADFARLLERDRNSLLERNALLVEDSAALRKELSDCEAELARGRTCFENENASSVHQLVEIERESLRKAKNLLAEVEAYQAARLDDLKDEQDRMTFEVVSALHDKIVLFLGQSSEG